MHIFLIALALLLLFLLVMNWLAKVAPQHISTLMELAVGSFLLVLGVFLALTGKVAFAIPALLGSLVAFRKYQQSRLPGEDRTGEKKSTATGAMSRDEAYKVLGLKPGASREEVRTAYKKFMLKMHPDVEGSEYLAQKINQARDLLLDKK